MVVWLYPSINRIPKSHKQVLGKHIEELCIRILLTVIKANKTHGQTRLALQCEFSDDLDSLRILVRLTKELKFISVKQYTLAAEKMNEIGRMLQGWMKATHV